MAKSLQQIRQDLAAFEEKTTELAGLLNDLYRKHLTSLSQSVKQQLILAFYQICTQIYPDEFLKLSFNQREKLQGNLRQLARGIESKLLACLEIRPQIPQSTITEQILLQLSRTEDSSFELPNAESQSPISEIKNPEELVHWCQTIEQGISDSLDQLSHEANNYLQQAKIIPTNLPPQLIEMALQAEEVGMAAGGTPNILNLLVETNTQQPEEDEETEEEKQAKITKISAIRLRLPEIIFADATLSLELKEIRNLLEKLKKMRQNYRQTQREYAKAEAETAWRASWHE
ncbi:conserved hypothetical protein [Rippkaea orientalis PCC 8801]|uniref:Uncharacterized protein n=1 Tax=Rippkaea orientalis (strain PCC 8801 / RF-1) TaxID=41431 RepID=B7K4T0_RIPO1|nr:hypothetical protein [Rippkaea orientalis]ACK66586.1 conserved hypothetical protein [Rippkaea orientalis PCC 8801]